MLAKVYAPALLSLDSRLIEIECDLANGLPAFVVVGLGDKAVDEARERVRSAIKNSGLVLPQKRITLNLAPADLPKDGSGYDLAMAVAILAASGQLEGPLDNALFLGELSLDGVIRPVKGALLASQLASDRSLKTLYVPAANAAEAALLTSTQVIGVDTLQDLYRHLTGEQPLNPTVAPVVHLKAAAPPVDLADVYGQDQAKRALEIAAAGGHNLLLSGPPGAGKTLLSKALVGLLPPLEFAEMIELTKLYSLAGLNPDGIVRSRPFRAPHHTASSVALIGGGTSPKPGEISLSHHGVLFLDELPEFPRGVLEVLRQPLEDGTVTVARAAGAVTFPANFMLVATRNPCPCGYAGDETKPCICNDGQISRYSRKVSGPLLDRIDLVVDVARVSNDHLVAAQPSEATAVVAQRIRQARRRQYRRYAECHILTNSAMNNHHLKRFAALDPEAAGLAREALTALNLSARAYTRVLKVARTIADLAGETSITAPHLAEALQYRSRS